MKQNKSLSSILVLTGALAFSALPVWSQVEPKGQSPGGAPMEKMEGQKGPEEGKSPGMAAGSEEIKKVQQALKDKGHDPGRIDGVMGKQTQEALKTFQQAQGLKATGVLDDQTKKALGLEQGGSKPEGETPAPARETTPKEKTSDTQG